MNSNLPSMTWLPSFLLLRIFHISEKYWTFSIQFRQLFWKIQHKRRPTSYKRRPIHKSNRLGLLSQIYWKKNMETAENNPSTKRRADSRRPSEWGREANLECNGQDLRPCHSPPLDSEDGDPWKIFLCSQQGPQDRLYELCPHISHGSSTNAHR